MVNTIDREKVEVEDKSSEFHPAKVNKSVKFSGNDTDDFDDEVATINGVKEVNVMASAVKAKTSAKSQFY